jgi:chitinase
MEAGTGEQWLIDFTKAYRSVSPDTILAHAPQGPYFHPTYYKNGGYNTVEKQVGSMIDFYFVQFYNQEDTKYDSYNELFVKASGFFAGTSVS